METSWFFAVIVERQLTPTEDTSRKTAVYLRIVIGTVEHHRNSVTTKLELRGSHVLVRFALQWRNGRERL
ncbi:MAG: hypothetical protein ABI882_23870 [Acidobacteriota bacterium]